MIRSKNRSLALFGILSLFTMIGCGGGIQTSQSKTNPGPTPTQTPAAAVIFTGTQHLFFNSSPSFNDVMTFDVTFTQTGTNVTGKSVPNTGTAIGTLKSVGCIDLDQLTVTGTVQGSNFALILSDPSNTEISIMGIVSPLVGGNAQGNQNGNFSVTFPSTCSSSFAPVLTGTVAFQKAGA